jgi:hypothetical protein
MSNQSAFGLMTQVFFGAPIFGEIKAPAPVGRPTQMGYAEIQNLCRDLRQKGLQDRSIVTLVRRFSGSGLTNNYEMNKPLNWGVVTDLKTTVGFTGAAYFPLKVQWVKDGAITEHWPEELLLIHEAKSSWDLDNLIKEVL